MTQTALFVLIPGLIIGCLIYGISLKKNHLKPVCALTTLVTGALLAAAGAKLFGLASNLFADAAAYGIKALVDFNPEKISFAGGCLGFAAGAALSARWHRVNTAKALNLLALPGCLMLCAARIAQGHLGVVGFGDYIGGSVLDFFPLAAVDEWGDHYLAVYRLEALAALAAGVAIILTRKKKTFFPLFERTVYLVSALQLILELLKTTWLPLVISFIRLDQVLCAIFMLWALIRAVKRGSRPSGIVVFFLCLAINGVTQFIMDKPYLFFWVFSESVEMWLSANLYPLGLSVITLTVIIQICLIWQRRRRKRR